MSFIIKYFNEHATYGFSFFFRVAYSCKGIQETCRRVNTFHI